MMFSHHPASKGKSSKHGVVLVLLVLLTVLFSGCFALPTSGSGPVGTSVSNSSLVETREGSGFSQAGDLVKRIDGPQASMEDNIRGVMAGWSVYTEAMFTDIPGMNAIMCRLKGVEADPMNTQWQSGSAQYLGNTHARLDLGWTRTIEQQCDLTSVAQAIHNLRTVNPISTVMKSNGGPNVCIRWTQDKAYAVNQGQAPGWVHTKVS